MNKHPSNMASIKRMAGYLKKEWLGILIAAIFAIISVYSMVVLPEVLGDTTDIVISGIVKKTIYNEVQEKYNLAKEMLNKVDEAKALVIEINSKTGEERSIYDSLLFYDYTIGHLKNKAKAPDSKMDDKTKEKILALPKEANNIYLRKVLGYFYDGEVKHKPLNEVDMTFREYLEEIEFVYTFNKSIPQDMVDYILNMKINDEDGYDIINQYERAVNVGDFIKNTKLESAFNIPKAYKNEIYSVNLREKPDTDWEALKEMIIKLAVLAFIYSVFAYLQGFFLTGVAQRISFRLRIEIHSKLFSMPMKKFDQKMKGDYMSLISNDIDNISNAFNQTISQIITTVTMMIGVLVMMIKLSITLSLIGVICVPISVLLMYLIGKKAKLHYKKTQETLSKVNALVEESFRGHETIQIFNKQEEHIEDFIKQNELLASESAKSEFSANLLQPASKFLGNLCYVCACVFGGISVINGHITIGNLQSFVQYLRQFTQPINQLATMFNLMQKSMVSINRVLDLIDEKDEEEVNLESIKEVKEGRVRFEHISFKYDKSYVIKDFNFEANKGEKIAIVGKTGAGKSTLMKLLLRFYDLNEGKIFIDDTDISKCERKNIREHVGIVLQDAWLFEGSVKDNIQYGNNATNEEIVDAAKRAMISEYIESIKDGYDHLISEGGNNFSHGQKQLLTIARAIAANKEILILDEATSSVDTKTEKALQNAMDNLIKEKTCFIIAHRLSTIKNSDKIIVMDDGQIVEVGNHKELMKKKAIYYNLYKSQFKC